MIDALSVAREKLAERILSEFKDKITGATDEPVVGDNPENCFFVGKLLTKDDDANSGYSSDVFIESVGADFYLSKADIDNAEITVFPRGEFYYRCYPTLEVQRNALLEEYSIHPEKFKDIKIKLVPVYRKKPIASSNLFVFFRPGELLDESRLYGYLDERSRENSLLMDQVNVLKEAINADESRYTYIVNERTGVQDLRTQESYIDFLTRSGKRDVVIQQNWSLYISVTIKRVKDKYQD